MPDCNTPIVRPATRRDIRELSTLIVAALSQFLEAAPRHIVLPYIESSRDIEKQWHNGEVLVLESESGLVGAGVYYASAACLGMSLPAEWAGMRTLVVHPNARGQGLGKLLVDHFIDRARADTAVTLGLHTSSFMTRAIRIYESVGFVRCPEHDLLASSLMRTDPARGEVPLLAYRLDLLHRVA